MAFVIPFLNIAIQSTDLLLGISGLVSVIFIWRFFHWMERRPQKEKLPDTDKQIARNEVTTEKFNPPITIKELWHDTAFMGKVLHESYENNPNELYVKLVLQQRRFAHIPFFTIGVPFEMLAHDLIRNGDKGIIPAWMKVKKGPNHIWTAIPRDANKASNMISKLDNKIYEILSNQKEQMYHKSLLDHVIHDKQAAIEVKQSEEARKTIEAYKQRKRDVM